MKIFNQHKKDYFSDIFDDEVNNYDIKTVGGRLKCLRYAKGLSVTDLSNIVGVSRVSVGNWERGDKKPRIQHLKKYADYFNVSIEWLQYGEFEDFLHNTIFDYIFNDCFEDYFNGKHLLADNKLLQSVINWGIRNNILGMNDFKEYEKLDSGIIEYITSIIEYILFKHEIPVKVNDTVPDSVSEQFIEYMKQFGYNSSKIINVTCELFNNDFKIIISQKNSEEVKKYPNIQKIQNKLKEYQVNNRDIDDGTTQAILTLLNHNHRDEED